VERVAAFRAEVAGAGKGTGGRVLELQDDEALDEALRALKRRAGRRPAAVVAGNALVTLRVASAVARLGWHFGRDVGFVGFDETEWSPLIGPGLTTVEQPTDDLGRIAASCLLERLQGRDFPARQILLAGRLIARGSSGAAPDAG
jgi:LacI family kdg operon repressor